MKRNLFMTLTLVTSVLYWGMTAHASTAQKKPISGTIVGGEDALAGEFPFLISIQDQSGFHFCGGSLINKRWVLTAAHCVQAGEEGAIRVVAGLHDLNEPTRAQTLEVERIIQHPRYGKGAISNDYDFALMELKQDAAYDSIPLNEQEIAIPDSEATSPLSITAGWGALKEGGNAATILQKVAVPLVSQANCTRSYPGRISDQMICAGLKIGGKDSCQGDSGGPLLTQDALGRSSLVGVVSWGTGCARPNKYGVYSKVNAVTSWINTTINSSR